MEGLWCNCTMDLCSDRRVFSIWFLAPLLTLLHFLTTTRFCRVIFKKTSTVIPSPCTSSEIQLSSLTKYIRISFLKLKNSALFRIANTRFHLSSYHHFAPLILTILKFLEMQFADTVICSFCHLHIHLLVWIAPDHSCQNSKIPTGLQLIHTNALLLISISLSDSYWCVRSSLFPHHSLIFL